ncbi:ribosome biogenesis protein bop1-B [Octopus sinensis]|uniref:Ribosome biogenesis protein BOP1 homolog n=1 Tax=Octopus sinensis TaxID=2607531 RepID=A0A6P7SIA9_9MOLL|nr:ribosome biogenesis protein bop1-B [Octopus sinensis]XP_036357797.1 ribosome biogenesis protein bop1-B [Octopus sinensis]
MVTKSEKRKRPVVENVEPISNDYDLWDKNVNEIDDSADLSDGSSGSEESVYSGLEEETSSEEGSDKDEHIFNESNKDNSDDDDEEEIGAFENVSSEEDVADVEEKATSRVNSSNTEDGINVKEIQPNTSDAGKSKTFVKNQPTSKDHSNKISDNIRKQENKENTVVSQLLDSSAAVDEYDEDSSDEEDIRNTVGNIPMQWYDDYEHIGYNLDGHKIKKPVHGDELDNFLEKLDDPNYWRTVSNKLTGQKVVLSDADIGIIKRLQRGKHPNKEVDPFAPWIDFFTYKTIKHPVTNRPPDKRSFIPSKWERLKVGQMVHAIKMGWLKPKPPRKDPDDEELNRTFYMMWKDNEEQELNKRFRHHIAAPKLALPGHAESYNPPPEYILTPEEEEAWRAKEPYERRMKFLPQKYTSLRLLPGYSRFIEERFERCLDLYLCPRKKVMKVKDLDPQDLLPTLPKPKDLQPFPTVQSVVYKGHKNMVRCISVHPKGQWLASGSDDCTIKIWEVSTGRCFKTISVEGTVKSIAWNPNPSLCLLVAVVNWSVVILNPGVVDKLIVSGTDELLKSFVTTETITEDAENVEKNTKLVMWESFEGKMYDAGLRLKIIHPQEVNHVSWHAKGDYFTSVMPSAHSMAVLIHQLTKRRSQNPFSKSKGIVQRVLFHPVKPLLFVATQRYVRIYNLLKQEMVKKLMTNVKWVSSIALHPGGDNLIIGSYDCHLSWFDLDLSTKPYKTLRHHKKAIRQVCYHNTYPLFASASDDCSLIVCHGRVYNDLLQNPLLVPVKVLHGHDSVNGLGVLDCQFHPTQPWLFSSGADGYIRLYT